MSKIRQPWASGPGEILKHSLELLETDSDVNRRLAMISVDNSVELMIKTYLGLPKRITGLNISRKELEQIKNSFPSLLNGLETHAKSNVLIGINLGEIEWFHRLRNELYHDGNGFTVEREKVEIYAELAKLLFKNLFDFEIELQKTTSLNLLYEFLDIWSQLAQELNILHYQISSLDGMTGGDSTSLSRIKVLNDLNLIDQKSMNRLLEIQQFREDLLLPQADFMKVITDELIDELKNYRMLLKQIELNASPVIINEKNQRERIGKLKAELDGLISVQPALREQMDRLKMRIEQLESQELKICPVCESELSQQHWQEVIIVLIEEGKEMGDRYRVNRDRIEDLKTEIKELSQIN